ncbi:hypothetical protein CCR75_005347 [Bremia lactucae]|uniref:Uncharacterized protein n=1 Tax=Bremia lactucae TaxID=4779 RepID=A0A976FIG0_BRELC|nr:hypothetical protein CCR75_005347 [Bremia lactucae]
MGQSRQNGQMSVPDMSTKRQQTTTALNAMRILERRYGVQDSEYFQHGEFQSMDYKRFIASTARVGEQNDEFYLSLSQPDADNKVAFAKNDGIFVSKLGQDHTLKVTLSKKRKNRRWSTTALTLIFGCIAIPVAEGIAVFQVFPMSSAASSINIAFFKVNELLSVLLKEILKESTPISKQVIKVIHTTYIALLQNEQLIAAARAINMTVSVKLRSRLHIIACIQGISQQLLSAILARVDALNVLMKQIQPHIQSIYKSILSGGSKLFDQVRVSEMGTGVFFKETLMQTEMWTQSMIELLSEWAPLKFTGSHAPPSDEIFTALETNRAAIINLGKELIVHASQALQDVKRFEKRRVAIAVETNAILAETRDFALGSVTRFKNAALKAIEYRFNQLEDQYGESIERALHQYQQMIRQIEEEGVATVEYQFGMVSTTHLHPLVAPNRALTQHEMGLDVKPAENVPYTDDKDGLRDERIADQCREAKDDSNPKSVFELEDLEVQVDKPQQLPFFDENVIQEDYKSVRKGIMATGPSEDYLPTVAPLASEHIIEVRAQLSTDMAQLPDELPARIQTSVLEVGEIVGRTSKYKGQDPTESAEVNIVSFELELASKELMAGKEDNDHVTKVLADSVSIVADLKRTQTGANVLMKMDNISDIINIKSDGKKLDQEPFVATHVDTASAGLESNNDMESRQIEADEAITKHVSIDEMTFFAYHPGIQAPAENSNVKAKIEQTVTDASLEVEINVLSRNGHEIGSSRKRSNYAGAVKEDISFRDASMIDNVQPGDALIFSDLNTLATEKRIKVNEILELENIEKALLHEDTDRTWVERELRKIAEVEMIWMKSSETSDDIQTAQQNALVEQCSTTSNSAAAADAIKSENILIHAFPRSDLTQISLLSLVFLGLVAVVMYYLFRHRKLRRVARQQNRPKRWQRRVDINESEEVVLLSSDSSDEENNSNADTSMETEAENSKSTQSVELNRKMAIEMLQHNEDEMDGAYEYEESPKMVAVSDNVSIGNNVPSKTYMADNTATPSSDALSDTTIGSLVFTPASSDVAQRTRLRRRPILM